MNSSEIKQSGWIEDGYSITKDKYIENQESIKKGILEILQKLDWNNFNEFFYLILENHDGSMHDWDEGGTCNYCVIQQMVSPFDVTWYAYCECGHIFGTHLNIKLDCAEEGCKCKRVNIVEYRRAFLKEENYV